MNWNYPFGTAEFIFVIIFIVVYAAYFVRTIRVARRLKSTARTLIVKFFIRSIAFTLLIVSLLGPSFGEAERELEAQGKDIYLLVDLSKSMNATDVSPTRLEKVKFEINKLLTSNINNRIGLIVFSNDAYTQSPLTYDQAAFNLYVQSLQTDLLPGSGTNVCSALELAYPKIAQDKLHPTKPKSWFFLPMANITPTAMLRSLITFGGLVSGCSWWGYTPEGSFIRVGDTVLKDEDGESVVSKLRDDVIRKPGPANAGNRI